MREAGKRQSVLFLVLDLLRDITVFVDLELKLVIAEVRRNIGSARRGVIQVVIGLLLLLLALFVLTCSAIAALAIILPFWLASLVVGALYAASGAWFLLAGKNLLSKSSPLPTESIARIREVSRKMRA